MREHLTTKPFIVEPKGGVGGVADKELPLTETLKGVVVFVPWYVPTINPKNDEIPEGIIIVPVPSVVG